MNIFGHVKVFLYIFDNNFGIGIGTNWISGQSVFIFLNS